MSELEGFKECSADDKSTCHSKRLIEAFIMRRVPCMGKRYEDKAELKLEYNRLLMYLNRHSKYSDVVRLSTTGGMLRLIRKDMEGEL